MYEKKMFPVILRDPVATKKLLEAIHDAPNGRRSLSRLARTCRALSEPALKILWRELDSIVPILGLFPGHVLKKARRPGLGLVKTPQGDDWKNVLRYGELVQRLTYDENSNAVATSVFPILDESRPRTYILPSLRELTWKAETAAGLDRCALFLNPELRVVHLEIGTNLKLAQIGAFLADMSSRSKLSGFSFISPTSLPDAFTELLLRQDALEKVLLVAPGALSPGVGRWTAALPQLKHLQLDLTGRSPIAVEGFFDELRPRSGDSTPSSIGSTDSGVFSGEELDFTEIRKSALRLTGDLMSKGSFAQMRKLNLTGEVANIAVFLRHLDSPLTQLDLVIEDPPDKADWQDLCGLLCDRFGDTLQSLRITATGSSKFMDLVRSTSRADAPSGHLSLEYLSELPKLTRFDIDLPESVLFTPFDIECLAHACPNLETLRLCPLARFPSLNGPPTLTLESFSFLTSQCRRLHTLGVVINATHGNSELLRTQAASSPSLLRLHVGHSWISDPLQVSILLSHLAPRLDSIKWFQEKNRPGFVEANAKNWQTVSDTLPHLQLVRFTERSFLRVIEPVRPVMLEKGIDATVETMSRGISAQVRTVNAAIQWSPRVTDQAVEAIAKSSSVAIDATPAIQEASVDARPLTASVYVDATTSTSSKGVDTFEVISPTYGSQKWLMGQFSSAFYVIPSIFSFLSFVYRLFIRNPLSLSTRILHLAAVDRISALRGQSTTASSKKVPASDTTSSPVSRAQDIPLSTLQENTYAQLYDTYDYAHEIHATPFPLSPKISIKPLEVSVALWSKKGVEQTDSNNNATRHSKWLEQRNKTPSWISIMADNKKQEKDYTKEVDSLLPEVESIAKSGKLQDALDKLFALEKHTRNAADLTSTLRLVKAAVQHCYDARDYTLLNSTISLLSKKHGQLKAAVQAIVEQVLSWLDKVRERDGNEKWLELVETLRGVTEGKIFLETPRARVTLLLAHYHEGLSQSATSPDPKESLQTASDLLSDLQVETYSSMERREKTEFILEQMRLLIAVARQKDDELEKKDGKDSLGGGEAEWIKVRVGGRKVNEEFLKDKDNEDLKLKYYDMMIQHALHGDSYLDVAKYYYKVWETPSIKEDVNDKGRAALEHIAYYVVLAPHNNEQSDMLHHLFVDPALAKLELHYNLVKCFTTRELMRWPGIESLYGKFLRKTPVFSSEKCWEDLHTRVIEHNIRVVAQYYTRITLTRLTSLLDLTPKQTEEVLARLVVSATIWARIDRPTGIVNFKNKRSAEDVMNDWSSDMQKLLGLVEKTWMGVNAAQAAQSRVKA